MVINHCFLLPFAAWCLNSRDANGAKAGVPMQRLWVPALVEALRRRQAPLQSPPEC